MSNIKDPDELFYPSSESDKQRRLSYYDGGAL
jgi:hypothetical protein